jgi:hypothetical protein
MQVRQAEIGDHEVGPFECCDLQAVGGILRFDDRKAMDLEAGTQEAPILGSPSISKTRLPALLIMAGARFGKAVADGGQPD